MTLVRTKRILLLGDSFPPALLSRLRRLDFAGQLETVEISPKFLIKNMLEDLLLSEIPHGDALICRPTRGGHVSEGMVRKMKSGFVLGTLSRATDHISSGNLEPDSVPTIVSSTGDANPRAVAELAVTLANLLLRPVHLALQTVKEGYFDNCQFSESRSLSKLTWVILGAGRQAKELQRILTAWGLDRIIVYHPQMNPSRKAQFPSTDRLVLTDNIRSALSIADVVSLHMPLVRGTDPSGTPSNLTYVRLGPNRGEVGYPLDSGNPNM